MNVDDTGMVFDNLVDAILPFGGGVVLLANVYFDESGTHAGSRLMSMAGYWFEKQKAARFTRDWSKDLHRLGISHAHMTDCALGFGEYKNRSREERVKIQSLLIEHIKRRSKFGFGICLSPDAYQSAMEDISGAPSAYTFCLMMCMNKVSEFASGIGYEGKIGYFFEAGHADANEAQRFMNHIPAEGSGLSESYRYAAHAFIDKKLALPLQAADMFAWHLRHYYERCLDDHFTPRKDFVALCRKFDFQTLVTQHHLLAYRELLMRAGPLFEQGQLKDFGIMGQNVMRDFGLSQKPTLVPKNTRIAKGLKSNRPTLRY